MQVRELHTWKADYKEAVRIQNQLVSRLVLEGGPSAVRTVAGVDVSYDKKDNRVFACVVLFDYPGLGLVEKAQAQLEASFPYIPGLLSFREGPAVLEAFRKLKEPPDLILFDAQGIAHPRGLGLASHLGLILDVPSVGCAKSRLVGEHEPVPEEVGGYSWLEHLGRRVGAVVRTKAKVQPIFVSPGHRISLADAVKWALACCRGYRLPEPTRQAHKLAGQARTQRPHQQSSLF
jgi:deoxyribonuclease V